MSNGTASENASRVTSSRRRRIAGTGALAVCTVAALSGAGMIGGAVTRDMPMLAPPQPPSVAAPATVAQPSPSGPSFASGAARGLPPSTPTTVSIRRIGVQAKILALGVNDDKTVQVPPLAQAMDVGWYKFGASPGEVGNAVILGHVDSPTIGPAVFFRLGELRPGDLIEVTRTDRVQAAFRVDGVKSYPKTAFPTELVYGPSGRPSLRVITCGGRFDEKNGSYTDNVIVFATLISSRRT
ncbi:class F sortase [Micromonospora aurantiaca (nom. illeg.)]|uniref:class F sortase n=1 Tax=Micromonospora aurantiaca (nom. illeg.) TaxID=47850 RepID=UPI003F49B9FF